MNNTIDAIELIKSDEGGGPKCKGRLMMYKDTRGYNTIGYGRNLTRGISLDEAEQFLINDLKDVQVDICERWPWAFELDAVRWKAFVSLVFNLGAHGLAEFVHMLSALRSKNYERAAEELYGSEWYTQVGERGPRLVAMMKDGIE